MATAFRSNLSSGVISDELRAMPDYIFYQKAQPNNTNVASSMFEFGGIQGNVEMIAEIQTLLTLADTKVLTLTLELYTDKDDVSADSSVVLYTKTASGATELAVGTELVRYKPPKGQSMWAKLRITSTDTSAVGKIDAYLVKIAN